MKNKLKRKERRRNIVYIALHKVSYLVGLAYFTNKEEGTKI